jgi:two-component system chemotaxis sensor kinase CheA
MKNPSDMTVLVVEDDDVLRNALVMRLEMEGFRLLSASGGREALEILNQGHSIDFILSDIQMPNGDGVELLKKIRARHPKIPIICLLSGYSTYNKEEIIQAGAIDLVSKPPDMNLICRYIQEASKTAA